MFKKKKTDRSSHGSVSFGEGVCVCVCMCVHEREREREREREEIYLRIWRVVLFRECGLKLITMP